MLIDSETYSKTYERIKTKYGKELAMKWTEKTDPQKFVFEDCAIASYLIVNFLVCDTEVFKGIVG